jgi:PKD repeat protein
MGSKLAVAVVVALFAVLAPSAAAVVVHQPDGQFLSIAPVKGVPASSIPGSVAAQHAAAPLSSNGNLDYHNGPVVRSSAPYLIFWTPSGETIGATTESLVGSYFTDAAADSGKSSNIWGVNRQFTDQAGFVDYTQTFSSSAQAIEDTQPYPTTGNCARTSVQHPTCLTDGQLRAEITRLIGADGLPTDGPTSALELDQDAPVYFVVLPADVNECTSSSVCADNNFCAYHSVFNTGGSRVLYASIPTLLAATSPKSCQSDGNSAVQAPNGDQVGDVILKAMSHEYSETITDPLGSGWWDSASGNEDGDNCNFTGAFSPTTGNNPNAFTPTLGGSAAAGTLFNQSMNTDSYYIQSEWSNGDVDCKLRPSAGTISASFSSSGHTTGQPVSFDPSASSSSNGYSSVTWGFGDGGGSFDRSGASPSTLSHTYGAPGTYTVSLTLVDPVGRISRASHAVSVTGGTATPPTAAFTFSPAAPVQGSPVSFDGSGSSDPNAGATITSYSWNFGDSSTGGGEFPSHTYSSPGIYTSTLRVTDSLGLQSTATSQQVVVAPTPTTVPVTPVTPVVPVVPPASDETPTAAFALRTSFRGTGQPLKFDASASSDPDGSIVAYAWNFGDGSVGSGASPSHAFRRPGTYTVTLGVMDSSGLSASTFWRVTVFKARILSHAVRNKSNTGATILITVNAPGKLSGLGKPLRVTQGGAAKLKLKLTWTQHGTLAAGGKLSVPLTIRFAPSVGAASTVKLTIKF